MPHKSYPNLKQIPSLCQEKKKIPKDLKLEHDRNHSRRMKDNKILASERSMTFYLYDKRTLRQRRELSWSDKILVLNFAKVYSDYVKNTRWFGIRMQWLELGNLLGLLSGVHWRKITLGPEYWSTGGSNDENFLIFLRGSHLKKNSNHTN